MKLCRSRCRIRRRHVLSLLLEEALALIAEEDRRVDLAAFCGSFIFGVKCRRAEWAFEPVVQRHSTVGIIAETSTSDRHDPA